MCFEYWIIFERYLRAEIFEKNSVLIFLQEIEHFLINLLQQESPFSLSINLQKTFNKNMNGNDHVPSSDIFLNTNEISKTEKVKKFLWVPW